MKRVVTRKFKYGFLSVVLSIVVIAVIVIVNTVFQTLAFKFGWYVDMTFEKMYEASDEVFEYIDKIDAKSNNITIYFFTEKDNLNYTVYSGNSLTDTSLWGMKPIHELALRLDDKYDFISVEYIDYTSDPDKVRDIIGEEAYGSSNFTDRHILITNDTYQKNPDGTPIKGPDGNPIAHTDYKMFSRNSFYLFDYNSGVVNAYRGDYYMTAAILSLTKVDRPTVYFLAGHGEAVGGTAEAELSSFGDATALAYLFEECGYKTRKIDLKYDDFDSSDKNSIVVLYGPKKDITSSLTVQTVSETDKLNAFLGRDKNSMIVFFNEKSSELTNLISLIKEYSDVTVSDTKAFDSGASSVSVDGYSIVGRYQNDPKERAYPIANRLVSAKMAYKAVFADSYPILLSEDSDKTSAVVLLPDSSNTYSYDSTAALMSESKLNGGGSMLLCASTEFANNAMIESDIYSNKNLIISALYDANDGYVPLNIDVKNVKDEGLDRTEREARLWTLLIAVLIPAAVATVGIIVYARRKHS